MPPRFVYHGLGYVGLTGACHYIKAGIDVVGFDPSAKVVDAINAGAPLAKEFLGYLGDGIKLPRATTNFDEIANEAVHLLAVPTEIDGTPVMSIVKHAVAMLLERVPSGATIVVESTLTPGTIDGMLSGSGGQRVRDGEVFLIHAPRRDWFADPERNLTNMTRVVGTVGELARGMAMAILGVVTPPDKILLTDYRTAELVKPLENALFHAPIVLAHQLACVYPDANVAEAVRLASTHWRFASFGGMHVGLGAGGRCVPMGPKYLLDGAPAPAAAAVLRANVFGNYDVAATVAQVIVSYRPRPVSVIILGMGYRPEFSDVGGSPAMVLANHLDHQHMTVRTHDPFLDDMPDADLATLCAASDVVVLSTPHAAYSSLPVRVAWRHGQLVVDARGAWRDFSLRARGVDYRVVGEPGWRRTEPSP